MDSDCALLLSFITLGLSTLFGCLKMLMNFVEIWIAINCCTVDVVAASESQYALEISSFISMTMSFSDGRATCTPWPSLNVTQRVVHSLYCKIIHTSGPYLNCLGPQNAFLLSFEIILSHGLSALGVEFHLETSPSLEKGWLIIGLQGPHSSLLRPMLGFLHS